MTCRVAPTGGPRFVDLGLPPTEPGDNTKAGSSTPTHSRWIRAATHRTRRAARLTRGTCTPESQRGDHRDLPPGRTRHLWRLLHGDRRRRAPTHGARRV